MTTHLTSDPHFGHVKVALIRGFATTDEHDEAVLDSYRAALRKGDDLWILGDLTAGGRAAEERALELLWRLREDVGVRLHLVNGNHDSVSGVHRDGYKRQRRFMLTFDSVQDFARRRGPAREPVFLSHYPFAADGDGPHREGARYLEYRLPDMGQWLIHGHTHQPEFRSGPRSLHVGWDSHRKPVPWSTIEQIIEKENA